MGDQNQAEKLIQLYALKGELTYEIEIEKRAMEMASQRELDEKLQNALGPKIKKLEVINNRIAETKCEAGGDKNAKQSQAVN